MGRNVIDRLYLRRPYRRRGARCQAKRFPGADIRTIYTNRHLDVTASARLRDRTVETTGNTGNSQRATTIYTRQINHEQKKQCSDTTLHCHIYFLVTACKLMKLLKQRGVNLHNCCEKVCCTRTVLRQTRPRYAFPQALSSRDI